MWVRFWIKSNRGTDQEGYEWLPDVDMDENDGTIKEALEDWCSQFGAWDHSDNIVDYGYELVERPPHPALEAKLAEVQSQIDRLRASEAAVFLAMRRQELTARVRTEWDCREEHLNETIQSINDGRDCCAVDEIPEPNRYADWTPDRKRAYINRLIGLHAKKRGLAEKYAEQGIEVIFNHDDEPKIGSVILNLAAEEWADLLNKNGRFLEACCDKVSRIRDILSSTLREGGEIRSGDLWEAVQLIEGHDDCDAFPEDHPLRKLVELWNAIKEDAEIGMPGVFRDPNDPKDALDVLYACAGIVAWKHLCGPHTSNGEHRQKVAVNFALSQMWPAIKTVYNKLTELGFDPVEGWAVCLGDEVLDSRSGFCIFQRHEEAKNVLNRVNAAAYTEWERAKIRRLHDIESGEYQEGGRYEGQPIPPVPQKRDCTVRQIRVSMECGIEFLPQEDESEEEHEK